MSAPVVYAAVLCMAALALEALCAGGDIRKRLRDVRTPRFVPPLWGWAAIGLFYYAMSFAVLYRLFSLGTDLPLTKVALALTLLVMVLNAAWNWFFFRSRNLLHAFVVSLAYSALAVVLLVVLVTVDRTAAACLLPYVVYLVYANFWGYALWRLNRP